MGKSWVSFVLVLLVCSLAVSIPNIKPAKASPHVVIAADGIVEGTDLIEQNGDYYTLTADLVCDKNSDGIVVQRDNIVLDGNGFSVIQPDDVSGGGIDISGRTNVTVKDFNIVGFSIGVYIYNIDSYENGNNLIVGNNVTAADNTKYQLGIWDQGSTGNRIIDNKVSGFNQFGIHLYLTTDCYLSGNIVTENKVGVSIHFKCANSVLRNNQMYDNELNFEVQCSSLTGFIHDIDSTNTVNHKPVYYWINQHNRTVPVDAGYVGLGNCSGIIVHDLIIENNGNGIFLYSTNNSKITNNHLEHNGNAVEIRSSENVTVSGNTLVNNFYSGFRLGISKNVTITENTLENNKYAVTLTGQTLEHGGYSGSQNVSILCNNFTGNEPAVDITGSMYNVVSGNNFTNNRFAGIRAVSCQHNLIVGNTFTINEDPAIYLSGAYNNTIYHNNFINNKAEGLAVSNPWLLQGGGKYEQNTWDNGSEGNYWSDYSTRYNNATKLDDSNIWNTPYVINEKNIDRFPLTEAVDIEPATIPEYPVTFILPLIVASSILIVILKKKRLQNR